MLTVFLCSQGTLINLQSNGNVIRCASPMRCRQLEGTAVLLVGLLCITNIPWIWNAATGITGLLTRTGPTKGLVVFVAYIGCAVLPPGIFVRGNALPLKRFRNKTTGAVHLSLS